MLEKILPAHLNIVSLPSTNLFLQGRNDLCKVRRGIVPVKELMARDFSVAFASDNVRDAFNPFSNANLLQIAHLAAHGCHMGGTEELETVFDMVTSVPREMMGLSQEIAPGCRADLVLLPASSAAQAIIEQVGILERIFRGAPDGRWSQAK